MSKTFSARARRWVGASVVAIAVAGLAGAGWAVEQAPAPAVLQPAALIQAPASNDVLSQGFANLVDAVKPAVVSVYVRAHGNPDETPGSDNGGGWRVGAGAEFALSRNTFVKAEYRYSNYEGSLSRNQVVGGFGFRF